MEEERKCIVKIKKIAGIKTANCYSCLYHEETETNRHFCALDLPKANLTSFPFKKEQPSCWEANFWDSPKFTKMLRKNAKHHNNAVHFLFNNVLGKLNNLSPELYSILFWFWYCVLKTKYLFSLILKR